jgi:hypothetical protein
MQRANLFIAGPPIRRARYLAFCLLAALAVLLLGALTPAGAVQLTSLYVVVVPIAEPAAAAQAAMRVELVRLTGRRSAASDPALAALIDNAHQYVERERATTSGQLQVLFDEPALAAAIAATGVTLWDPDRPLLWIWLPPLDAASDQAVRARLSQAAQERGLPVTLAAPAAVAAAPVAAAPPTPASTAPAAPAAAASAPLATLAPPASAQAPTGASALDAARAVGANAALVATLVPTQPGTLQWTLTAGDGGGQWVGSPELAIDQAADTLAAAAVAINRAPMGQFVCRISGVTDLSSLVSVLNAVHAAPGVTQVDVSDVSGDQLTLQLAARGSGPQLEHALAGARLQPTGTGTEGLLEYRYVAAR